jgi:predicted lipid carrier protein YhbT
MTTSHSPVAALPPLIHLALRPLPLAPLRPLLAAVLRRVLRRHPGIFERLGPYAGKRYGLAPTDLPFAFVLDTAPRAPMVTAVRSLPKVDATITGPLRALIGMADGAYDGDALFFSRTIVIEGDIEAVLALRNAIDDAGVNVVREAAALLGPLGRIARAFLDPGRNEAPARNRHGRKEHPPWN